MRRNECVPNLLGSSPTLATHSPTRRAYWRVVSPRKVSPRAGKQELAGLPAGQPQVLVDRLPRLVGEFEPHRSARLSLANRRTIERIAVRCHVIDADGDNVTAAQLAVDRQVEQRKIARARLYLELGPIDQTWLGRSGGFAPTSFPLFQGGRRAGVSAADA